MRAAFSWITIEQLTERVGAAIEAGTFNSRPDHRHLTWTPIALDETGWDRVVAAVNALFEETLEEQKRSKLRIAESGEAPSLATVALAAFESPPQVGGKDDRQASPNQADVIDQKKGIDTSLFFPMQLAKVLADPEALQILAQLNLREMSPKQFHDEFGAGTMSSVGRRFQKLAKTGWLTMVREESGGKRRGATEHFYRAIGPAILDRDDWSELPEPLKATLTWKTFEQFRERAREAIGAGTFDARTDRHLTWSLLLLDQAGWKKVIADIDALFQTIFLEERSAESRIAKSGKKPIQITVGLAAFESPKDSTKAP
jgi:DNA-binding transcriptional ArsR family regulator